jgi:hypothetical protein
MPPSGYDKSQAQYVSDFLTSCSKALEREGCELSETPLEALAREISDIQRYLSSESTLSTSQIGILELTKDFYSRVFALSPTIYSDYRIAVSQSVSAIENQVLAIHIEPEFTV